MAFFEQRKNGWRAQIRRRGMPSVSRTFDLRADAEAWAREVERELQRGRLSVLDTSAQRTTVSDVIARFRSSVADSYAQSNRAVTLSRLRTIEERFGPLFLSAVRPADLARWRDDMQANGLSAQSAKHGLNLLSRLFGFAADEMGVTLPAGNPARGVRKPTVARGRDRRLMPNELDVLLAAARAPRAAVGLDVFIILAVETSMRMGEQVSLRWERIDLTRRIAHLPDTKNGSSRTVALSTAAVGALQGLPRRTDGRVWNWATSSGFEAIWKRCRARARRLYEADCVAQGVDPDPKFLADLRFHDLRHEATSRLFEAGLSLMEVASMTGHRSPGMLQRYTHIEASRLAQKLG